MSKHYNPFWIVLQETLKDEHLGCGVTDTTSTKAKTSQETQFPHVKRSLQQGV